jgi:hypothetical protein
MIRVEQYQMEHKENWNSFLSTSINGSFLFNRDYLDYHSDRFKDFSLIIYNESEIVGLLPANILENTVYSHQGLTYGGLVVNVKNTLLSTLNIFNEIFKYYKTVGVSEIVYKPIPSFYNLKTFNDDEYLLFLVDAVLIRRDVSSVIDLDVDIKYQDRRYRGIKKSIKAGVIIKESFTCNEFWEKVLIPNLNERYNLKPVHTIDEMNSLMLKFPLNIKQYNIYLQSEIIGGVLLFLNQGCVHAQYIAATVAGKQINALDFLFDRMINQTKENGKRYFSFGMSNENAGLFLNKGLIEWKESFGARSFSNNFYRIDFSKTDKLQSILNQ